MFINLKLREISLKIVYYGPALSGKTTNLERIHLKIRPELRGELISLKTREDRTIFFDFLQLEVGEIKGLKPKFNLYTVPGQAIYASSRKLVLQGVDGIVFVASSQWSQLQENVNSMACLREHLHQLGINAASIPLVIQYNKRDLPGCLPIPVLDKNLCYNGVPRIEAVATQGIGVIDTLKKIIDSTMNKVRRDIC